MSADYTLIADLAARLPEIPSDSIVSRGLPTVGPVKLTIFGFAPGQELSEHTSSRFAILHVLSGEAELTLGGDAHSAQAGTFVAMPPHLPHSIVAKTATTMLLIQVDDAR
jgi:quercetin dioxygenase-like cupin family protein